MALTAVSIKPSITPYHSSFYTFEQNSLFIESVLKIITPAEINSKGATLSQITQSSKTFNIFCKIYHAERKGWTKNYFKNWPSTPLTHPISSLLLIFAINI
ncbi:hypothetical protein [Coxiella endosymbiont of Ornithodoros maritimus]|uniref:hypothetical protein n=1 Tax=Coxiella endosymbiont of Ornithodoros maritimus TaxID=1656172 RepID=UPI002265603A|nr:hypothetical protein [Coxiella endosymbiont of Ornithodoros maritimus]